MTVHSFINIMQQKTQVVAEGQSALDKSLMMTIPGPKKPEPQPTLTLKQLQRDVEHLISRLPSNFRQLQTTQPDNNNQLDQPTQSVQLHHTGQLQQSQVQPSGAVGQKGVQPGRRQFLLSRYNYTGRSYRFEQAESQLDVSKPELKQTSKTELNITLQKKKEDNLSMANERCSNLAEQSFDASEVKFPNHNYYIVFGKELKKKQLKHNALDTKSYLLEKKVKRLEEQMRSIRVNETTQSFNVKKDGKMRLEKLLDSIIG